VAYLVLFINDILRVFYIAMSYYITTFILESISMFLGTCFIYYLAVTLNMGFDGLIIGFASSTIFMFIAVYGYYSWSPALNEFRTQQLHHQTSMLISLDRPS
jgi:Na+-driven multidrug efflux pump